MEMIKLANTDIEVPRLGAGCMGLGGGCSGISSLTRASGPGTGISSIANLYLGINFFYSCRYLCQRPGRGVFGRVQGSVLPSLRARIVLSVEVRCPAGGHPPGRSAIDFTLDTLSLASMQAQRRLGTHYLDTPSFYTGHVLCDGEEVASAFSSLKSEGKVRTPAYRSRTVRGISTFKVSFPIPSL